jgi:hypothetical protein
MVLVDFEMFLQVIDGNYVHDLLLEL